MLCDSVNRKLMLLVAELRYKVSVAGIQDTKWFGADVWPATGGLLHSGRSTPGGCLEGRCRYFIGYKRATEISW